jgi:hypothetical protein
MSILFLPIDIDMSNFNFTQFDSSVKLKSTYNPFWDSTVISEDTVIQNKFGKVLEQLPFKKITVLTYKIQQRPVGPHVDVYPDMLFEDGELEHIKQHEPSGYRFVLAGATDSVEVFNGVDWVTATTPAVPCCYLLNSTEAKHRVKSDPSRTIIYVRGLLDTDKHQNLITRSYSKYKDYAIESVL